MATLAAQAPLLAAAVLAVFEHPVIGRCQLHKIRNVADYLPERMRPSAGTRMRAAYHAQADLAAEGAWLLALHITVGPVTAPTVPAPLARRP